MNQIYSVQKHRCHQQKIYWDRQNDNKNEEDDLEIPAFLRRQKN